MIPSRIATKMSMRMQLILPCGMSTELPAQPLFDLLQQILRGTAVGDGEAADGEPG
jgi:hypothetical protein